MKLKGNLELSALGNSHIENLFPEEIAVPSFVSGDSGRIIFDTGSNTLTYNNGTEWLSIADSSNILSLQNEVDALESSLGTMVDGDGVYQAGVLNALGNVTGSTDLTDVLQQLDTAISAGAGNTLPSLNDVNITSAAANDFIVADVSGTAYVNLNGTAARAAMGVVIGTDVQAFEAGLDSIAGLTMSNNEMLYADGDNSFLTTPLTAAARDLLDDANATAMRATLGVEIGTDVQPADPTLTALAGFNTNGILVQTAADTFAGRTIITSTSNAITITNGDGVSDDPSIAIEAGLDSIAGLTMAPDEMLYADGDNSFVRTPLTLAARGLLDDATVADMRATLELTAGATGDIWVKSAGDTMTGPLNMGTQKITSLLAPTDAGDAVNKQYADSIAAGLDPKNSCHASTTGNLGTFTYAASGGANDGVGDTLTANSNGVTTIDDVILTAIDQRVLVKDQATSLQNGIYEVTTLGTGSVATVLTRALDFDGSPANEVSEGAFTFVVEGTVNNNSGWIVTGTASIAGGDIVVGNDNIVFTQSSGAGTLVAGDGLVQTGNVFDVGGAGGIAATGTAVGIDLFGTNALILTTDGTATSTDTSAQLHLLLDGTTLSQSVTGLKVATAGITETELNTSVAGAGLTGGGGSSLAVDVDTTGAAGTIGTLVVTANGVGVDLGTTNITAAPGNHVHTAAVVTFDPSGNGLSATNVQAAIVENDGRLTTLETGGQHATQAELEATQIGAGLTLDGDYPTATGNFISTATNLNNADHLLDTQLKTTDDRVSDSSFVSAALAASTSHIVTHNTGQRFCNVMVIEDVSGPQDETDMQMIIPDGIVFSSTTQLTVTFTTATKVRIVVQGLA